MKSADDCVLTNGYSRASGRDPQNSIQDRLDELLQCPGTVPDLRHAACWRQARRLFHLGSKDYSDLTGIRMWYVTNGGMAKEMVDRSTIAAIRFGYGLDPISRMPASPSEMLVDVGQRDDAEHLYQIASAQDRLRILDRREQIKFREAGNTEEVERIKKERRQSVRKLQWADSLSFFQRALDTRSPFRERLVEFWADHFSVPRKNQPLRTLQPDFLEQAIRPNIAGSFPELLEAAVLHPAMLQYLDQRQSFGPNSPVGRRREKGLNENLARELLELHTLGVRGPYQQSDVRELAELLTGVTVNSEGFAFNPRRAEPGKETVLGRSYAPDASLEVVRSALSDLALHPETAKHLSRKLIVHFVGHAPPEDWVEKMAGLYLSSGGQLLSLYSGLLDDERAWSPEFANIKRPFEFVVSAARGFGLSGADLGAIEPKVFRQMFVNQLARMGQPLYTPRAPDGWPEAPEAWITPALLAARIRWSFSFVRRFRSEQDPRKFVASVLGDVASPELNFAAANAEDRTEGLVVVLASPEFNRR